MESDELEKLVKRIGGGDPNAVSAFVSVHRDEIERRAASRLPRGFKWSLGDAWPELIAEAVSAMESTLRRIAARGGLKRVTLEQLWWYVLVLTVRTVTAVAREIRDPYRAVRKAAEMSAGEEAWAVARLPPLAPPFPLSLVSAGEDAAFQWLLSSLTDGLDKAITRWLRAGMSATDIARETGQGEWDIRARIDALPRAIRRFIDGEDNGAGHAVPA